MALARMDYRPGSKIRGGGFGVKIARAAAGHRSGKTADPGRRDRRVSNRKSWLFSSRERFRAKCIPVRVKKTRRELKPFAGVGVTDRRREEAEAEGQHEDVQHEMLLVTLVSTPKRCVLTRKAKCDRSTRERDWDRDLVRISRREVPLA